MTLVLPDTNILLWPFSGGPDIVEEISKIIPQSEIKIADCVIRELRIIDIPEAKAAFSMFKNFPIHNLGEGEADNLLLNAAREGAIIVTNDSDLITRFTTEKLPVARPRGRYKLELLGWLGARL